MFKRIWILVLIGLFCAVTEAAQTNTSSSNNENDPVTVSFDNYRGGIDFSNAKGDYTARIHGFIQADGFIFNGNTQDVIHHKANFSNGAWIPAARLYFGGTMASVWHYLFSYDFAISQLRYAYLSYTGLNHFEWRAGQYKPGFSFEFLTARTHIIFIGRALPVDAFIPGYAMGTQVLFYTDHFTAEGGVFGPNSSGRIQGIPVEGYQPLGASLRLVFSPIHALGKVFHLGVGGYFREAGSQHLTHFAAVPEIATQHFTTLVNTGDIAHSNNYHVENAEIAGVHGPFSAEGEYYIANVNRFGESELTFDGYYLALSYFLTGECRTYHFLNGSFSRITPVRNKYGAWELAARYSNLNLNSQNITGGVENNITLALNWYPINRIKLGLNYIFADATPSSNGLNRQMNIIALRLQTLF